MHTCTYSGMGSLAIASLLVLFVGLMHTKDLALLYEDGHQCTPVVNNKACFAASPQCITGLEGAISGKAGQMEYLCANKASFENNIACFMTDASDQAYRTCLEGVNDDNLCNLASCVETGLSTVPQCTRGGASLMAGAVNFITAKDCS